MQPPPIQTPFSDLKQIISQAWLRWFNLVGGSGNKIDILTRDTSIATGDASYTGVGFKPSAIIFLAGYTAAGGGSVGFSDATTHACYYNNHYAVADTWGLDATKCISAFSDTGKQALAIVKTMDADGFTLTWTKVGLATGTLTVAYLAFR